MVVMSPYALAAATYRHLPSVRIEKKTKNELYDMIQYEKGDDRIE